MPPFSVVVTVLNDRDGLGELLRALAAQTTAPDELVVADGGSSDGTLELLRAAEADAGFPVRVIAAPGAGISAGRNRAIAAARNEWIACTDAGCRPDPEWLAALAVATADADFVSGIYAVAGETAFERAQAAAIYPDPAEIGNAGALTRAWQRLFGKRYDAERATGRSMAFRRAVWEAIGGFPEGRNTGEDTWFSLRARALGFRLALAPGAIVAWRPRPTWTANARMFHAYARGDVEASLTRHVIRLAAWSGGPALAVFGGRPGRAAVLAGGIAYLALPLRRARRHGLPLSAWWQVPALIAAKDLTQLAGAAAGLRDRRRARRGGVDRG